MSSTNSSTSALGQWAQLVRLPNVFTVLADVGAAFLLVAAGPEPIARFALVLAAGVSLYWGGMILNDLFDIEKDRQERADRPLASGRISPASAKMAGWGCLAIGIALATASGLVPSAQSPVTWLPCGISVALAIMIYLYDGPLKTTLLAPAAMGGCRVLSFLLGASPVVTPDNTGFIPTYLICIAVGFGLYIMGITTIGRREAIGGRTPNLVTGLLVTIMGAAVLAIAPQFAEQPMGWRVSLGRGFPILIGLIVLPVILRGLRLLGDPAPANIQAMMRVSVLTIIPLAAAFAFLGAGQMWGLAVFALVIPAMLLSVRLRVT